MSTVTGQDSLPDSKDANLPGYCLFVAFVSALSSFQNGWNTSVTNVPEHVIRNCESINREYWLPNCLPMKNLLWGFVVASYALGGLIGGLSAGHLQTRLGRRRTLMVNNINFLLGALILGVAVNPSMFAIGRLLTGIGSGIGTVTVPTYLGEIATINARGFFGTSNQLFIVIGILVAQLAGFLLDYNPGWRILLALTAVPALIQLLLLPLCVETPRYLVSQHKIDEAKEALKRLRHGFVVDKEFEEIVEGQREIEVTASEGKSLQENRVITVRNKSLTFDVDKEFEEIIEGKKEIEVKASGESLQENRITTVRKSLTFVGLFKGPFYRKMALICLGLSALQQLCGINGIIFYSTAIFSNAFHEKAKYATLGIGAIIVIATAVSLGLIDKKGRRPLLLSSELGMSVFTFFVASFSIGLGPIPFSIIPELALTHSISATASAAMGLNWFCNFVVAFAFPVFAETLKSWTFLVFAIITGVGFALTFIFVPETKCRSIEAIHREIRGSKVVLDNGSDV